MAGCSGSTPPSYLSTAEDISAQVIWALLLYKEPTRSAGLGAASRGMGDAGRGG